MNLILKQLLILICYDLKLAECDISVTGQCGSPALPPHASKHKISSDKIRFQNKENVLILCSKKDFMYEQHPIQCINGQWIGKTPRCGNNMDAKAINLDIIDCESPGKELLLSQNLSLMDETVTGDGIPHNAFHRLRVDNETIISTSDSHCYTFNITFDLKIQYWFLTIDLYTYTNTTGPPDVTLIVSKYRKCQSRMNLTQVETIGPNERFITFSYYFICDLNFDSDYKKEQNEISNTLTFDVRTNFTDELGLDALFIGDIFVDSIRNKPQCGDIQHQNIGVDINGDSGLLFIACNDSFIDLNSNDIKEFAENGNPNHRFICNWNGIWTGSWPKCWPINTCSKDILMTYKPNSVLIEEIGNVYYLNESHWFLINDSYVRYSCNDVNHIMVGNKLRTCRKDGNWSNKAPYCTSTGISGLAISGIVFAILTVFVLIVLFVFRMHTKSFKREIRETKNEIQESNKGEDIQNVGNSYNNFRPDPAYDDVYVEPSYSKSE